jgi:hypothetical protein
MAAAPATRLRRERSIIMSSRTICMMVGSTTQDFRCHPE